MRDSQSTSAVRPRRLAAVLGLVLSLLAAFGVLQSGSAAAANTAPTAVVIDRVRSGTLAPDQTPTGSVPTVLATPGTSVFVDVSFYDASGAPASFTKTTSVVVSSNRGALSQVTKTVARGQTSATFEVTFGTTANQIALTVKVPGKPSFEDTVDPATDPSDTNKLFDVVSVIQFADATPFASFEKGIGGDGGCANATKDNPVCGVLRLPHGAELAAEAQGEVLLSLGACDVIFTGCGTTGASVVQALAGLSGLSYTKTDPATLIFKCDKSLCGGGAIASHHVFYSQAGNGLLDQAPACPAKGTIGASQAACVDYVQSTRDNSGDTHLYLLFTEDMRGSAA